jgi:hypothetical protein
MVNVRVFIGSPAQIDRCVARDLFGKVNSIKTLSHLLHKLLIIPTTKLQIIGIYLAQAKPNSLSINVSKINWFGVNERLVMVMIDRCH